VTGRGTELQPRRRVAARTGRTDVEVDLPTIHHQPGATLQILRMGVARTIRNTTQHRIRIHLPSTCVVLGVTQLSCTVTLLTTYRADEDDVRIRPERDLRLPVRTGGRRTKGRILILIFLGGVEVWVPGSGRASQLAY
jgi:hypothetical protein